jgi:hypothetical protein
MKADVAVIGGGSAGIAAAVAAARSGAEVLLVERNPSPGGNACSARVHTLCGLYLLRKDENKPLAYANQGFPREVAESLLSSGGARGPIRMGRLDVLLHSPEAFGALALELAGKFPNLRLLTGTSLKQVWKNDEGGIAALELTTPRGDITVDVAAAVDASGDSGLTFAAGAGTELAPLENLQRPAYVLGLSGIDPSLMRADGRLALAHTISSAVSNNQLPPEALGASFKEGIGSGETWMTIDLSAESFDPRNRSEREALMDGASDLAARITAFLAANVSGFRNARIQSQPEQIGIRESRRMAGRYTLTGNDVLTGRRFPEEAALSAWPVELRVKAGNVRLRFPEEERPCGIPMDALRSRDVPNLLAAGRCISSTHEAHAAIRVIGTSLATGEAAGKEAARVADQPCRRRHLDGVPQ